MTKKRTEEKVLEVGNLILSAIQATPDRCVVGETYIHYLAYAILQDKSFHDLAERVHFEYDEERPYSKEVQTAIRYLCKDVTEINTLDDSKIPMILTERVRDGYDTIREAEKWADKHSGMSVLPKVFMLTPNGILVAAYTWSSLLNFKQKVVIEETVRAIIRA